MEIGIIIVWAICGIVGALIMQSKNRQPWLGALLGFVLGIFGVLIVAVLSKRPPTSPLPLAHTTG